MVQSDEEQVAAVPGDAADSAGVAAPPASPSPSHVPPARNPKKRSALERIRRFAWMSLRTLLFVLLLVLLCAGALVWWLTQTESGRRSVVGTLTPWVSENLLVGDLYIGRLDGPVFGALSVHDVIITDSEGRAAIELDRLDVTYEVGPLLSLRVIVPTLEVDGLRVEAHVTPSGGLNLAELVAPSDEPEPESTGGLDVTLAAISVRNSNFVMLDDRSGEAQLVEVSSLLLDGRFEMTKDGRMDVALERVSLGLSPPVALDAVLPVALTELEVVIESNQIGAELQELTAGNTGLSGLSATINLDPTGRRLFEELRAQLPEVHIDPEEANQFVEGLNLLQPVDVRTSFSGPPDELAMRMAVQAGDNAASLAFVLDITDPAVPGYSGAMEVVRLRPHEVVDLQGMVADISAVLNVRGVGITPQDARANLMLDVGPSRVADYGLEYAWVTAHATYGEFVLDGLELAGMGAFARVEAAGNLEGQVSMDIEASVADLAAIAAVVPDFPVESGALGVELTLIGALPLELLQELTTIAPFDLVETIAGRIRLDGALDVRDVSAMGYSIEHASLALSSPPDLGAEILADLDVRGVDAGALAQIDALTVDARLTPEDSSFALLLQDSTNQRTVDTSLELAWDSDTIDIRVDRLNVDVQGLSARVENRPQATIRFDEAYAPLQARLTDTSLSLNRAMVALSGSWSADGAISAFVSTDPIDLSALNRVASLADDLSGTLALNSVVSGTLRSPSVSVTVRAQDVASGPVEDLDASFSAQLGGGELGLSADVQLGGRQLFAVETYGGGLPVAINLETGHYHIDQERTFGVRGELERFNLARVLGELEQTAIYDVSGDIRSSFDLRGSLSEPRFNVDVELSQLALRAPLRVDPGTGESQFARLGGLELVLAAEYTLTPRSRADWRAAVQEMAGGELVSRDAIFGGSSVAGCPVSLLSRVDGGSSRFSEDDAQSDAQAGQAGQRPGLRASLWTDRSGCPVVTSDVFVDADLRPVFDDPEALVLWLTRLAGEQLSSSQNRRADAMQRWMNGIRAGTLTRVGPLALDSMPDELRAMSGANSGVLETEIRASVDRSGGYLSMASALDRLMVKGLPLVSLVSTFRVDNEETAVELVGTVGSESLASDLISADGPVVQDAELLRSSLPDTVAVASASLRYDVSMGDIARGRTDFDRPLQARAQLVRLPIAELLDELGLTDIGLTLPGEDDGLLVLRGADASGYIDVTGTPSAPEMFGRVAMRGLQTLPEQTSSIGAELSFVDDVVETTFFVQDNRRSLLDGRMMVTLPSDWTETWLTDPIVERTSVEGWVRSRRAQLRDILAPQLVGAYLEDVSGLLDLNVAVEGALSAPAVEGRLTIENGRMGVIPIGRRIDELNVDVAIDGERIELSRFFVRDATGTALVTGNLLLHGLLPSAMDFDAEMRNFLVADPSGNGVFVSGDVRIDGETRNELLSMVVELDSLIVDVPDTAGSASYGPTAPPSTIYFVNEDVAPDQVGELTPQILESSGTTAVELPINMDVRVRTVGRNELHQSLADLVFDVDLLAALRGSSYSLRGAVRVPDGVVRVAGKQFELERGFVTFDGAVDTFNPIVDVRALHYLSSDVAARLEPASSGEANVSVVIDGNLEDLFDSGSSAIRLQSDPQMTQEDIIFVLLTGRPRDATSEVEGDQQALATASSLAAGLLADRLLAGTGIPIDTIRIDGDAQSGQAFARVEGGKYITEDVYVSGTYINSQDPRENDFEFALEWIILRLGSASLRSELRAGNKGNGGLELLWNLTRPGRRRVESEE